MRDRDRWRTVAVALAVFGMLELVAMIAYDLARGSPWRLGEALSRALFLLVPGLVPFVLIAWGRPRLPWLACVTAGVLVAVNLYDHSVAVFRLDYGDLAYALDVGLGPYFEIAIWGVAMVIEAVLRDRARRPPPRPDVEDRRTL